MKPVIISYDCVDHDPIDDWVPDDVYDVDFWMNFTIIVRAIMERTSLLRKWLLFSSCLALLVLPLEAAPAGRANLAQVYPAWDAWEREFSELDATVNRFGGLAERPFEKPADLLLALETWQSVHRMANKVGGYLHLRLELDSKDEEAQARELRMSGLTGRWEGKTSSWLVPRILALGEERVAEWMRKEPGLAVYQHYLRTLFRRAGHELPAREEELLALRDVLDEQTGRIHRALSTAEAGRPEIELAAGGTFEITPAASRTMLWELTDPVDRRLAQQALLEGLGRRSQTYAALLAGVVKGGKFVARARRYDSALAAALEREAIPVAAVETLISTARRRSEVLREIHRLRARSLGLEEYGSADQYVPLRPFANQVSYDEAKRLIVDSAAPLGEEVQAILREAFDNGWIDAFERPNKRASGTATYVYGDHPYVIVSYRSTVLDLFALAHELGHAVHSQLAHRAQPYVTSIPSTLTAEAVASLHELLLVERLLQEAGAPGERLAVTDFAVQNLLRSFYRPAIDADFELQVYAEEASLTADGLGTLYGQVLESYYGNALALKPWDRHGWQQVPHFFTAPLYMLRYGLAYASATALAEKLTSSDSAEREAAQRRYLDLLRAGGSDDPTVLLAAAGADLALPATFEAVFARLERLARTMSTIKESLPQ